MAFRIFFNITLDLFSGFQWDNTNFLTSSKNWSVCITPLFYQKAAKSPYIFSIKLIYTQINNSIYLFSQKKQKQINQDQKFAFCFFNLSYLNKNVLRDYVLLDIFWSVFDRNMISYSTYIGEVAAFFKKTKKRGIFLHKIIPFVL